MIWVHGQFSGCPLVSPHGLQWVSRHQLYTCSSHMLLSAVHQPDSVIKDRWQKVSQAELFHCWVTTQHRLHQFISMSTQHTYLPLNASPQIKKMDIILNKNMFLGFWKEFISMVRRHINLFWLVSCSHAVLKQPYQLDCVRYTCVSVYVPRAFWCKKNFTVIPFTVNIDIYSNMNQMTVSAQRKGSFLLLTRENMSSVWVL